MIIQDFLALEVVSQVFQDRGQEDQDRIMVTTVLLTEVTLCAAIMAHLHHATFRILEFHQVPNRLCSENTMI